MASETFGPLLACAAISSSKTTRSLLAGSNATRSTWVFGADSARALAPLIRVNTAMGRVKQRNMKEGTSVALAIIDPDNAYRYVEVRGRVREITQNGADDHINEMAKKYLGQDVYPFRGPGEQRVLYKIAIEHTHTMG